MGTVSPDELADDITRMDMPSYIVEVLRWHRAMGEERPHRLGGPGPTTSRAYQRRQARAMFLGALHRQVPDLTCDLLTPELDRLAEEALRARVRWIDKTDPWVEANEEILYAWERAKADPSYAEVEVANNAVGHFVAQWAKRHNLTDFWIKQAAWATVTMADAIERYGMGGDAPKPLPLLLPDHELWSGDVHDGLDKPVPPDPQNPFRTITLTGSHRQIHRLVWIDDLKYPTIDTDEGYWEDEGDFETFDPRTETIAAAVKRMTPKLQRRLTRALEAIAADDIALNEAVPASTLRGTTAFDWLVRYQVLRESRTAIAKAEGADRANVSRTVNETARLIGLTLRKETGGRPRNPKANTKRVR